MSKSELLWDLIADTCLDTDNWEIPLSVLYTISVKKDIYKTTHHFKSAVKHFQMQGRVELVNEKLRVVKGRLLK